jgi:hypothetical protein
MIDVLRKYSLYPEICIEGFKDFWVSIKGKYLFFLDS